MRDTTQREYQAAKKSMFFESFNRIGGASWIETAVISQDRAYNKLVRPDKEDQDMAHLSASLFQCCNNEAVYRPLSISSLPRRFNTTISRPANNF